MKVEIATCHWKQSNIITTSASSHDGETSCGLVLPTMNNYQTRQNI